MKVCHLIVGARATLMLTRCDGDRFDLSERIARTFGASLLAYAILATHLHVVVEAEREPARRRLEDALGRYGRAFALRHRGLPPLLRGPVEAFAAHDEEGLARQIRYVHDNPLRGRDGLVRPEQYAFSSAREYAGLCVAGRANAERAKVLARGRASWFALHRPPLADLEPSRVPLCRPEVLLVAAAETLGTLPERVASRLRSDPVAARARALFLRLGELESYAIGQLAPTLGRSRSAAYRAVAPVDETTLRIARTLLRHPLIGAVLRSRAAG